MKKLTLVLASLALSSLAHSGETPSAKNNAGPIVDPVSPASTNIFGGVDAREYAWYAHTGVVHALNNDLDSSGLAVRAFTGAGEYEYTNFGLPDPAVTGRILDVDLSLGYRFVTPNFTLGAFAGPHVRDINLNAVDPSNDIGGTEWGARFGLDLTGNTGPIYWSGLGQYSTIEDSVWTRARVGYAFDRVTVGPEFVYMDDNRFQEYRVGGFAKVQILENFSLNGAAGYSTYEGPITTRGQDENSFYGSLGFSVTF